MAQQDPPVRRDLTIKLDGVELAAWHYRPAGPGPFPIVVLSHGIAAVKEMSLDRVAEVFAAAGLACLVYDHRNCGGSTGAPRNEFDPWQLVSDMRDAMTFAQMLPDVDPERLGLWGTSWSGGHVLNVAANDRRVKCVVAQVPTISSYRNATRAIPVERLASLHAEHQRERIARAQGAPPTYVRLAAEGSDSDLWSKVAGVGTPYSNEITLLTRELRLAYEPGLAISRISPTPLLMVLSRNDVRCPIDDQLAAYNQALEPKRLVLLEGGHYDPYMATLPQAAAAARDWFVEHLLRPETAPIAPF